MGPKNKKPVSKTRLHRGSEKSVTEQDAIKALEANHKKASELLKDENRMNDFLTQLDSKFNAVTGLKEKFANIPLIVSLVRSYIKGEYKELPLGTVIGLVSALIYFVSPIDIIPDFIPGLGYVDDLMVLAVAIRFAYTDLEDYKKWLEQKEDQTDVPNVQIENIQEENI